MLLQYLGTAAAEGWPAVFCRCPSCQEARRRGGKDIRTRSQAIIDGKLLIDLPQDTYMHALTQGLDLSAVYGLIVTHSHSDHFYPKELEMRGGCYAHNMAEPVLHAIGNQTVVERYRQSVPAQETVDFCYAPPFQSVTMGDYRVTPLLALHNRREECYLYIVEKPSEGKRILYAHDTGFFPEKTIQYIQGMRFDLISFDCTNGPLTDGANHMGLEDDLQMRRWLKKWGCCDSGTVCVVNHFSHNGGLLHQELEERAKPLGFLVSYDGFQVEI